MADARAAVVARQEELPMPETLHDFEHVLGQYAGAVIDVIGTGVGQRTVAVAAQIGENHMVAFRKPRGDAIPGRVVLRIAVQEQQRRAGTAMADTYDGTLRAEVKMLEIRKQGRELGAAPARRITDIVGRCCFGHHRGLLRR